MDIISSALDANQFAPDECLVSTFDAQEQLQQRSSRLDIWRFGAGREGNGIHLGGHYCKIQSQRRRIMVFQILL